MIPNDRAFNGKPYYEDKGKRISRWYYLKREGKFEIIFRFRSVKSPNKQGIALFFSDFAGQIMLEGRKLPIPKGRFKHYVFEEGEMPDNTIHLKVECKKGYLYFGNASERKETGFFTCGAFGNAFWFETISPNTRRFHCNDHEYDDDFNDCVFDMELICSE